MTTSAPLVTVVIPTYNRCGYLAETIDSVLAQDHPAIEIVVVNDGSTDATADVLRQFGSRINVITQPNSGQGAAVNRGLGVATGDYITLVSDDDPILPNALSRLVDVLETNLDVLVAYPDWFIIDSNGEQTGRMALLDYSFVDMARHHLCHPGPCALFRRIAVELTGGWDLRWRWVADYDFWLRLGLHGPMVHVDEPLATWRHHQTGATQDAPRLALAKEQVAVVESFLARSDLPAEIRAVETEAIAAAWAVGFIVAMDGFETPSLPRFQLADRFAQHIVRSAPVARNRTGTPLEVATRRATELTQLLELSTNDRAALLRHVDVLQRRVALLDEDASDGAIEGPIEGASDA